MAAQARTGTGFVGLQDYLNANQQAVPATANTLADSASQQAQGAENTANDVANHAVYGAAKDAHGNATDPTAATGYAGAQQGLANASQQLRGLSTFGGVSDQLQQQYGNKGANPYTSGDRSFDANLLGGSSQAQGAFHNAQSKFAGLDTYLQDASGAAQARGMADGMPKPVAAAQPTTQVPGASGPPPTPANKPVTNGDQYQNPYGPRFYGRGQAPVQGPLAYDNGHNGTGYGSQGPRNGQNRGGF